MTLKFVRHHDANCNNEECWHVFNAAVTDITPEGVVKVYGEIVNMDDHMDWNGSIGYINFIDGVPVWSSNFIGNATCGVSDDLTATQLREIAEFMETLSVADIELAKLGL